MAARHKRRAGRGWKILLVCLGVFALLGGGTAYAAYRYDRSASGRILPGVSVAGVDVGDLTRDAAMRRVQEQADLRLSGSVTVHAGDRSWELTAADLGVSADVDAAVDQALALADDLSLFSRVYHRIADEPIERSFDLEFAYDQAAVDAFVRQAATEVAVEPVDARFVLEDGELVTRRSQTGVELKSGVAVQVIMRALAHQGDTVDVPTRALAPEVTTASLGKSIVVDISDNTLQLYDGLKVKRQYRVATGTPQYPTPVGTFEIVNKVENPTWYNPALDTWGAGLPASIGPGPGNPLGTRAMYLNAPGIRIHGTWDDSSIGTAASHGCIRMHVQDSEALYPHVPIGTRVIVKP